MIIIISLSEIIKLLNNNQGVIAVLGMFVVIPFALLSDKFISFFRQRSYRRELKLILLHELWININTVAAIENSYKNNILDAGGLHIPHYPPRNEVFGKFIQQDILNSLNEYEKRGVLEIYAQLEGLKGEYYIWRKLLLKGLSLDVEEYKIISSTMISYINPVMRNMMELWVRVVSEIGKNSPNKQINETYKIIKARLKSKMIIAPTYKASYIKNNKEYYANVNVIMCWINDWPDAPIEVIEIQDIACLHPNWRRENNIICEPRQDSTQFLNQ